MTFFINKHSDVPVPALCSCCARSVLAPVWVTLAQTLVLQCPGPASALQLAAQGLPCHQQGHGESASDLKGTHQALRAGWALQAWHRQELATPALLMPEACCGGLALPHRTDLCAAARWPSRPLPLTPQPLTEHQVLVPAATGRHCPGTGASYARCWCLSIKGWGSCEFPAAVVKKGVAPHEMLVLYRVFVTRQQCQGC